MAKPKRSRTERVEHCCVTHGVIDVRVTTVCSYVQPITRHDVITEDNGKILAVRDLLRYGGEDLPALLHNEKFESTWICSS